MCPSAGLLLPQRRSCPSLLFGQSFQAIFQIRNKMHFKKHKRCSSRFLSKYLNKTTWICKNLNISLDRSLNFPRNPLDFRRCKWTRMRKECRFQNIWRILSKCPLVFLQGTLLGKGLPTLLKSRGPTRLTRGHICENSKMRLRERRWKRSSSKKKKNEKKEKTSIIFRIHLEKQGLVLLIETDI